MKTGDTIILQRIQMSERGTKGGLVGMGISTLELPWKNNRRMVSCIPPGVYRADKVKHKKFGHTFVLRNVPGRSGIYIHRGNWLWQILGCIEVGMEFDFLPAKNQWAVMMSDIAMRRLLRLTSGVEWCYFDIRNP